MWCLMRSKEQNMASASSGLFVSLQMKCSGNFWECAQGVLCHTGNNSFDSSGNLDKDLNVRYNTNVK